MSLAIRLAAGIFEHAGVVIPPDPDLGTFIMGMNFPGLEFTSNHIPGAVGVDYFAPSVSYYSYYKQKGFTHIRLPFNWARMQPTLGGALDPAYLSLVKTACDNAFAQGIRVILDCHNYGGYSGLGKIGGGSVTPSDFAFFWGLMAAEFVGYPGCGGYDIMNEWNTMPSPDIVPAAAQAAVTAIRAKDAATVIYIEGDNYSSAGLWTTYNNNLHIVDPSNNIIYSAHMYPDWENSGTHPDWQESVNAGVTIQTGVERCTVFVEWLEAHGYVGNIGETGAYNTDPNWLLSMDSTLAYLQQHKIGVFFWAGTGFGSPSYPLAINTEADGRDAVQMAVLTKYTGAPQPSTYYFTGPSRGTPNVASTDFTVSYRGIASNTVQIVPNDLGAGGTFTPPSLTISSGFNGTAAFTYTQPSAITAAISVANNTGWADPKAIGYSTRADLFMSISAAPRNIFSFRRIYTPYIGPAVRYRRLSDNVEQDFYFLATDEIDEAAVALWAAGSAYTLVWWYDQSPNGRHAQPVFSDNSVGPSTPADYPAMVIGTNGKRVSRWSSSRMDAKSPINGLTGHTTCIVMNPTSVSGSQRAVSWAFTDGYVITGNSSGQAYDSNEPVPYTSLGVDPGVWHTYAVRFRGA